MIDLIANTKPEAGHRDPITAIPLCPSLQGRTHDAAVLAALAVSFGTMSVCRSTHRRPIRSRVVGVGLTAVELPRLGLVDTQDEAWPSRWESKCHARRFFPPAYKAEVVEPIRSTGKTVGQVAPELDLTETAVCEWVRRADLDAGRRTDGLTTAEREELRRLRREVRDLREEREILPKAAVFFAPETGHR
jgi:transposase